MSFKSILKTIAIDALKVLGVADKAIPFVTTFVAPVLTPVARGVVNTIDTGINLAESVFTQAQQGVAKKESVTQIITDTLPTVTELVDLFGPGFVYDSDLLSKAIDSSVQAKNDVANFISSIKKKG